MELNLHATVLSPDGKTKVEDSISGKVSVDSFERQQEAFQLGRTLGTQLRQKGATPILESVRSTAYI